MKDGAALLVVSAGCALFAWAFWHFLGRNAVDVLLLVTLVSTVVDNFRLRRKLREKNAEHGGESPPSI